MNIRVEKACGIDMHQAFLMATMLDLAGTKDTRRAQVALNFGANDLGGTMIEENVVRAAGVPFHSKSIDEFVYIAKKMGRPVAKRNTLYNIIERY